MKMGPDPFSHSIRCARIPDAMSVFLIDHHGYIRPFLIDDITIGLTELGINPELLPLLKDIIHANLVYGFAEQIGLKPGLFELGDEAICENIKKRISYNIETTAQDKVLEILLESWNNVASHPLAEALRQSTNIDQSAKPENKHIVAFDYYHVFFKNIFSGLLSLWKNPDVPSIILYMNIAEIYFSAIEGRAYLRNDYFNYDLLLKELEDCLANSTGEYSHQLLSCIDAVKTRRDWAQKNCLMHIGGWCEGELLDLEEEFDKTLLSTALSNLLKRADTLSASDELNKKLRDIYCFNKYLYKIGKEHSDHIAGLTKFVFKEDREDQNISDHEIERHLHEAIEYTIMKFAKGHGINIYATIFERPESLRFMALSNEEIIEHLYEKKIFQPYQLYILYNLNKSLEIREIIHSLVDNYDKESNISFPLLRILGYSPPIISPIEILSKQTKQFTPSYRHLKSLVLGGGGTINGVGVEKALTSISNLSSPRLN